MNLFPVLDTALERARERNKQRQRPDISYRRSLVLKIYYFSYKRDREWKGDVLICLCRFLLNHSKFGAHHHQRGYHHHHHHHLCSMYCWREDAASAWSSHPLGARAGNSSALAAPAGLLLADSEGRSSFDIEISDAWCAPRMVLAK